MGLQIKIPLAVLLGQNGAVAARVHHVFGCHWLTLGGEDGDVIIVELDVLNGRILPNLSAVGNGRAHHEVVRVLPVQVQFVAVRLLGNNRLERVRRIVRLPFFMVQKAKMPLDAVRRARKRHEVFCAEIGQLRHVVKMGQRPHHLRSFQNERFANGKTRVRLCLEDDHPLPMPRQNRPQGAAAHARTNNYNVKISLCHM